MKIIAVDISYRKPVAIACLTSKGEFAWWTLVEPHNDIFHTVQAVLEGVIKDPHAIVVAETPLLINNRNNAFVMTKFFAMLEMGVRSAGIKFFGIHPLTWQAAILKPKKGDDRKALSVASAQKFLGSEVRSDDLADALNLARFTYNNRKNILKAIAGKGKFSEKLGK